MWIIPTGGHRGRDMEITRYKPKGWVDYHYSDETIYDALCYGGLWAETEMVEDKEGEFVALKDAISWANYWKKKYLKECKK